MAMQFEARKVALKQDKTGYILTLSLHPDEVPEEIFRDFVGARYACAVVRINDDESPVTYNNRVQRAAIMCRNPELWEHMGVASEEEAVRKLCSMCSIESRSELNGNKKAQRIFDELVTEFEEAHDPFR
jgi:hypothetical protein